MAEKIRYEKKKTRLTEKYQQPPESLIRIFMGIEAWKRLMRFEEMLRERYDVSREIRLLPEIQASWLNRYACGADGGWLNRSVISDEELPDLIRLVGVKVKPKKIGGKNA